jgi:transposase
VKLKNGRIVSAVKSTYKRNGVQNLFAALEVAIGTIHSKVTTTKKRPDFIEFMNDVLSELPQKEDIEYHAILDNYCTHKRCDEWLAAHPNVYFHYTPTSASWLNQVEIWFNIFTRKVLRGASFDSKEELKKTIEEFVKYYNETVHPFVWKKRKVVGSQIKDNLSNLCG